MATSPDGNSHTLNRRHLRVQDLRRLRHLVFSSRRVIEGQYAGRHASPQRGHSVEFNDYRQYMPGDEIGDIDWKVYGRTDKLVVKLFEHQADMTVNVLVDASASMAYPAEPGEPKTRVQRRAIRRRGAKAEAEPTSKYDHACMMAAAIAFLTTRQQDKVGLGFAQDGLKEYRRPRMSFTHLDGVLQAMERTTPHGEASLARSLQDIARVTTRRSLLVVFSDLMEPPDPIIHALSIFAHRGTEVIVFHVLHADELNLPDMDEAILVDSESNRRMALNVADVRGAYDERLKLYLRMWSTACMARGIDYNLVSTAVPYQKALENYLFTRAAAK